MPQFNYQALNRDGQTVNGTTEAVSSAHALERLKHQGLQPYQVLPAISSQAPWWRRDISFGRHMPQAMLARFTRELATLVDADLPLDECLRILARHGSSRRLRNLGNELLEQILEGKSLSQCVAARPADFPPFYAAMLRAGEAGGTLGQTLLHLAAFLERAAELRARLHSALIYPAILVMMAITTIIVLMTVMIPQLMPLFDSAQVEPPAVFRYALVLERAFTEQWPITLAVVAAVVLITMGLARNDRFVTALHGWILKMPVAGSLVGKSNTARLCRGLGTLLSNGVSIHPALQILTPSLSNRKMRSALAHILAQLREGATFSTELSRTGMFSEVAVRLIVVGERSGRLPEMLLHATQILEAETQRQIERLMSLLTPILTLIIGLGVGTLILSVMHALLSVNDLAF